MITSAGSDGALLLVNLQSGFYRRRGHVAASLGSIAPLMSVATTLAKNVRNRLRQCHRTLSHHR